MLLRDQGLPGWLFSRMGLFVGGVFPACRAFLWLRKSPVRDEQHYFLSQGIRWFEGQMQMGYRDEDESMQVMMCHILKECFQKNVFSP